VKLRRAGDWQAVGGSAAENTRDVSMTSSADRDDIMKTLLSHEKSAAAAAGVGGVGGGASTQSSTSDSDIDDELTTNNYSGNTHTHITHHGRPRCGLLLLLSKVVDFITF